MRGMTLFAVADAHVCPAEVGGVEAEGEDWMESEVVAGFRVWQILFLGAAGLGALVVACCCVTRCRVPRTRQEIEANHRRNQITQLFRGHLDSIVVDEVDLMWALGEVKACAEKPAQPPAPRLTLLQRTKLLLTRQRTRSEDSLHCDEASIED